MCVFFSFSFFLLSFGSSFLVCIIFILCLEEAEGEGREGVGGVVEGGEDGEKRRGGQGEEGI